MLILNNATAEVRPLRLAASSGPDPDPAHGPDFDHERHRVIRLDGSAAPLGATAWAALTCLHRHRGHVVTDQQLFLAVWPGRLPDAENALRQVVLQVRRALAGTRWQIVTHRTLGRELVEIDRERAT
ncbi:MAG: winged helix-turn-helix domain-containing protein [Stellaceae bacterium]